jgi:glycosyltransferase 2 family protein
MKLLRSLLRLGLKLLGPALLLYFLWTTDLPKLWSTLLATDPWLMGLSMLLIVPFLVMKGWRWKLILEAWRIRIGLLDATALYGVGMFLGIMTPGQAGDAVKAWYLRQRGHSLTTGLASVVLDRLFDVGIMGALAASGLYFFWDALPGGKAVNVITVAAMLTAVVVGLTVAATPALRERLLTIMPRGLREKLNLDVLGTMHFEPSDVARVALVSAGGLAITFVRIYLLFLALDTQIPIGPFIALVATIAIVGAASPGGVGTRDVVMIFALQSLLAMPAADAQARALALSTLLLVLNVENVVIGYLLSLRYPLAAIRDERPTTKDQRRTTPA